MYKTLLKPFLDVLTALIGLILLSPIFLLVTVALTLANQDQPFFTQIRLGKHSRLFRIIKFKTMNDRRDEQGDLLPDAQRLTPLGSFVRKTSLDEIPQLLNVIKGDMSLVGPRPLLPEYLPLYTPEQARRHDVKPGITGWAQVNGRNALSWAEKFRHDIYYVDHCSFALDLHILFKTVGKVLKREGISQAGQATIKKFNGNN